MLARTLIAALALVLAGAAHAQDAPAPEMWQAALQAATSQRDQALNDGVRLSAQLTMAQREVARLRKDLDDAKRVSSAEPAK